MKKFLFIFVAVMALSLTAFAQDAKPVATPAAKKPSRFFVQDISAPLAENQFGGYFVYDRSDAQTPENSVGAGAFVIRNFNLGKQPVNVKADFYAVTDQAFPATGRVVRGEFKARTPLGLKYNFVGIDSEVYAVAQAAVENQGGKTSFQPSFGAGFKTGDNVLTEYHYVFPTGVANFQGHQVTVEFYRPLENNPNWNVFTGITGTTGKFSFTPVDPQALMNVKFFVGISRK